MKNPNLLFIIGLLFISCNQSPQPTSAPVAESTIHYENLIEGVQIAQKDKFFNFTKGRIITLDY